MALQLPDQWDLSLLNSIHVTVANQFTVLVWVAQDVQAQIVYTSCWTLKWCTPRNRVTNSWFSIEYLDIPHSNSCTNPFPGPGLSLTRNPFVANSCWNLHVIALWKFPIHTTARMICLTISCFFIKKGWLWDYGVSFLVGTYPGHIFYNQGLLVGSWSSFWQVPWLRTMYNVQCYGLNFNFCSLCFIGFAHQILCLMCNM